MTKEAKTTRNLKVIEQSGYRYQAMLNWIYRISAKSPAFKR